MKKRHAALRNKHYHINLKCGGMATVTGKLSPELLEALNRMTELAKSLKSPKQ